MITRCDKCNSTCDDPRNTRLRTGVAICYWCATERARHDGVLMLVGAAALTIILLAVGLR